jgi:hypothetical protein
VLLHDQVEQTQHRAIARRRDRLGNSAWSADADASKHVVRCMLSAACCPLHVCPLQSYDWASCDPSDSTGSNRRAQSWSDVGLPGKCTLIINVATCSRVQTVAKLLTHQIGAAVAWLSTLVRSVGLRRAAVGWRTLVAWADNAFCLKSGGAAERRSAIHASYLNHNATGR